MVDSKAGARKKEKPGHLIVLEIEKPLGKMKKRTEANLKLFAITKRTAI